MLNIPKFFHLKFYLIHYWVAQGHSFLVLCLYNNKEIKEREKKVVYLCVGWCV